VTKLIDAFDAFLIDLDGVVWRGDASVPGSDEAVERLREAGKRVVFVTNNGSRSPRDFAAKLMRHRIPTEIGDVVTSAHAVVAGLQENDLRRGDRVHVCGTDALAGFIAANGFDVTKDEDAAAVVVAWNPQLVMDDIRRAANVARSGAVFIAANRDATYPEETGLVPGSGAILAAVETASGRTAQVVGKPAAELFRAAMDRAGSSTDATLFVGDRVDSDVVGAKAIGLPVALVLTGVTSAEDVDAIADGPDWVAPDLAAVLDLTDDREPSPAVAAPEPVVVIRPVEPVVTGDAGGSPASPERDDERHPGEEPADVRPERDAAATLFDT
jgi:glycerol-1-phosphatase